jgi:murein DD-endopeptidase MepM/ murein hydrolase activator NlpD
MLSVGFITILSIGVFPLPAHAGLGDFFTSIFSFKREIPTETASKVSEQALFLRAATNIDPNPAKGGGDITIVGGVALLAETGPSGSIADIEEGTQSDQINIYVVREGDTLSGIAKMFGVSTNTILWANDLKRSSALKVGQTLTILPVSGVRHTVKSGDTLATIAKKYKGDLEEIKEFNELGDGAKLASGMVIVVPHGVIEAAPTPALKKPILAGGPAINGYFARPLSGGLRTQAIHGYNAVDLAAPQGTSIFASAAGTVIIAKDYGWNGGYGNYVVIKHDNGTQTLYAHMRSVQTSVGAVVAQGDVLGTVGNTGRSTGPHLHFEVRGARNPFGY